MPGRDVFICHTRADWATHAQPLRTALTLAGISCWTDEAQILPGESIVEKVSEGLGSARLVAVLVTRALMLRAWPQRELNAALSKEIRTGQTVVIPILCTDQDPYFDRYPLMRDKAYLDWSEGIDEITARICALFPRSPAHEWHCVHPTRHVGLVWVRLLPQHDHIGSPHRLTLRWGPYIKEIKARPDSPGPMSFVHHKTKPDSVVLHTSVDPPSVITFGHGVPPDAAALNIDEGWTRTAGSTWLDD